MNFAECLVVGCFTPIIAVFLGWLALRCLNMLLVKATLPLTGLGLLTLLTAVAVIIPEFLRPYMLNFSLNDIPALALAFSGLILHAPLVEIDLAELIV